MKSMLVCLVALCCALNSSAQSQLSQITAKHISDISGHPGPFQLQKGAGVTDFHRVGNVIDQISVNAPKGSFPSMGIVLFEGGTYLTDEVRNQFETSLHSYHAAMAKNIADEQAALDAEGDPDLREIRRGLLDALIRDFERNAPVRRIAIPADGDGYAFITGVGPGGAVYGAALSSPDGKYDLVILTVVTSGERTHSDPGTDAYWAEFRNEPLKWMADMATNLIHKLAAEDSEASP